jgi:hypothetical protein
MWWGPWWPGFGVMVAFMLLCGVFMIGMGGMRRTGGMCGWWRGRDDVDAAHRTEGFRSSNLRNDTAENEAQADRRTR